METRYRHDTHKLVHPQTNRLLPCLSMPSNIVNAHRHNPLTLQPLHRQACLSKARCFILTDIFCHGKKHSRSEETLRQMNCARLYEISGYIEEIYHRLDQVCTTYHFLVLGIQFLFVCGDAVCACSIKPAAKDSSCLT